ncbi:RadC family protein [Paracraurococcus lichenis]|uniref:DNA repair protein RadC n=1 Tax=Paracraurococcus lichenis TaxID=3064888 RepID=A0ABT9E3H6_9PROT|nr:DNA repair protein RadC [Paracraurococcus sp. LOR1-02]MDO9710717.1 DNA repair protein RadC [Paracraurococcus sp. LOR1-02]
MRKLDVGKGLSDAGLLQPFTLRDPLRVPPPAARPRRRAPADPRLPGLLPEAGAEPEPGHLGHRARMRRRLLTAGGEGLLDHEMLEMVLFLALPRRDTKPIARALLDRFGSYANAIAAPITELLAVEGLGEAGAAALKTVHAAALRLARQEAKQLELLNNWDRLIDYLTVQLARERVEHVRVLYLDTRNRLIADELQGRGTVNHTPLYPREVVKRALELQATAMILVHNHPSGDPTPSRADIEMTGEVKAAAQVFGIVLHDHIIIGNGMHVSLRREGLL